MLGDLRVRGSGGCSPRRGARSARVTRHGDRARVDRAATRPAAASRELPIRVFAAARLGEKKGAKRRRGRELRTGLSPFLRVANSSADSIILTILEPWGWG